jgi:hypothetical protein
MSFHHYVIMYCTYDMLSEEVVKGVMCHRPLCVMHLSQASWQGSCASGTHRCPTLSMFPRHRDVREHVMGGMWRGNTDSVGHLCVPDAQLPCQDAWLKCMTHNGLWHMTPLTTSSLSMSYVQYIVT